ncbi:hypothetical protein ACJX0J_020124, partial [Zea mays]
MSDPIHLSSFRSSLLFILCLSRQMGLETPVILGHDKQVILGSIGPFGVVILHEIIHDWVFFGGSYENEKLKGENALLDKGVEKGHISGVLGDLVPGGISHIQYADDTVIMIDGSDRSLSLGLKIIAGWDLVPISVHATQDKGTSDNWLREHGLNACPVSSSVRL